MLGIIGAAGWPIWLIILASIVAVTIIIERLLSLRQSVIAPKDLLAKVIQEYKQRGVHPDMIKQLSESSLLGQVLAVGLRNVKSSREIMKEAIEESGRAAAHEMERFLTSLGTVASMSPLLGLLGTVIGMIEIFGSQTPTGGNPAVLAHGISVALYNTAFGLIVAIPSMIFYRHFRAKVEGFVVEMEQQAIKLTEVVHGDRQN